MIDHLCHQRLDARPEYVLRAVSGPVVNDDYFLIIYRRGEDRCHDTLNGVGLVETRHDYG
jgi:hypothetical protein